MARKRHAIICQRLPPQLFCLQQRAIICSFAPASLRTNSATIALLRAAHNHNVISIANGGASP